MEHFNDMCHYNADAERNVLLALASNHKQAGKVLAELREDDFFDGACKRRFQKFKNAYNAGQLAEFGIQHIAALDIPENVMKLWDAVNMIIHHSVRRRVEAAMSSVMSDIRDYSVGIKDTQERIKSALMDAIDSRVCKAPSLTVDDLDSFIGSMQNSECSFFTGLDSIDRNAPIQPGDFVVIGARPAVGKSALVSGMLLENFIGRENKNGIFFCIEMDNRQNYARLSSQITQVPLAKYINPQSNPPSNGELAAVAESVDLIRSKFPERWFVEGAVTLTEICNMVEIHKPDFIVVDYVQIIGCAGIGCERLETISKQLRQLGLDQKVTVIALAQLNRDANGSIPSMSQIKGSGQFEQDATHIFLLDRPESEKLNAVGKRAYFDKRGDAVSIYNPQSPTNRAALIVAKNRNGPQFYTILNFDGSTTTFREYE